MNLQAYLDRIGFRREPEPDLKTLCDIHREHVFSIPYENLDVQFGRPVSRAPEDLFNKIVKNCRGGWCYEMNGVLCWALEEIGFSVRQLAGAVKRKEIGDATIGNHLVLIVELDQLYLVDAGFGDGLIEPVPLAPGPIANGPFSCQLEQINDGWWRYHDDPRSGDTYDFNLDVTDDTLLETACQYLQTNDASPFVQNAVVQRWTPDTHFALRGRILSTTNKSETSRQIVDDEDAYVRILREKFRLDLPAAAALWPKICARHDALAKSGDLPPMITSG